MENNVTKINGSTSVMEAIKSQIDNAVKNGANLIMPQQILSNVPAMHSITIEHVTISSKLEAGRIYPHPKHDVCAGEQPGDKAMRLLKNTILFLIGAAGFIVAMNEGQGFPFINFLGALMFFVAVLGSNLMERSKERAKEEI